MLILGVLLLAGPVGLFIYALVDTWLANRDWRRGNARWR
jgi:hypothetical protein